MLRLLGLIAIVVLAGFGGWYLRGRVPDKQATVTEVKSWGTVSVEGASRAKSQIASLSRGTKTFVAIAPEDLAAYVSMLATNKLPPSASDMRATAEGDRLTLRAMLKPAELDVGKVLGALAGLLRDTEELRLTGTFHLVRPGLAEFRIVDARLRDIPIPGPMIPTLIRQSVPGTRPEGVSDNAVPLPLPEHVQDIRVSGGRMLVYRRNP